MLLLHVLDYHWQGFIQRGGPWNSLPPPPQATIFPPEILKLSMVINYCMFWTITGRVSYRGPPQATIFPPEILKLSMVINCCPRLQSKLSWWGGGGGGGGACPQTPLVGTHAFTRYYHPATIPFFSSQLKILHETLTGIFI